MRPDGQENPMQQQLYLDVLMMPLPVLWLTAFTYLYIFETTTPLSSYLQTSGLGMFTAWSLVDSATTKLKGQTRTFDNVHSKALEFVNK